jgi:hypothetical protein
MYNGFRIVIKPGCTGIVLAAYNLLAQGIYRFHETVISCVNLVRMTFVAVLIVHLTAMFELFVFVRVFSIDVKTAKYKHC